MTPRLSIEPARLAGAALLRCQTDERLVDLVRAGNDRAFEAIVDRYSRPLLRYCSRLLPRSRAEDVVQQTFLNAYTGLRRDEANIELRAWLYRIAHNASLNALRENGWSHERIERLLAGTESAHEIVQRRADLRAVLHAVQALPDRQREAIILRELEGRSYEQIASELGATDGAVRQLLNRARHRLRATVRGLTPSAPLARLPWGGGSPALERVSEAAVHEGLRSAVARAGGALVAAVAIAAGAVEGPRQLARLSGGGPAPADRAQQAGSPAGRPATGARSPLSFEVRGSRLPHPALLLAGLDASAVLEEVASRLASGPPAPWPPGGMTKRQSAPLGSKASAPPPASTAPARRPGRREPAGGRPGHRDPDPVGTVAALGQDSQRVLGIGTGVPAPGAIGMAEATEPVVATASDPPPPADQGAGTSAGADGQSATVTTGS